MPKKSLSCVLCGKSIRAAQPHSTYRVEGDIKGFAANVDIQKAFHNECLTREQGINEIARAQVLDYIEAVEFNRSVIEDLKGQNLDRAKKLLKEIQWRAKNQAPEK